jgi:hypothetical protein
MMLVVELIIFYLISIGWCIGVVCESQSRPMNPVIDAIFWPITVIKRRRRARLPRLPRAIVRLRR